MTKNVVSKAVRYYPWVDGEVTRFRSWPRPSGLALIPGIWTNITPETLALEDTFGASSIIFDPSNRDVLYATFDENGLWKSTDRGETWEELGSGTASGGSSTTRLDSPVCVSVDPEDPLHLVATQGIRGTSQGFWVSQDGGQTWTKPAGFSSVSPTDDVTSLAIDPQDWNHMLVGSHSFSWNGILETFDAGQTWTAHDAPEGWPTGSASLTILNHPQLEGGSPDIWLVGLDGEGIWRTDDGADTWTKVSNSGIPHGVVHPYYVSPSGVIFGGSNYVVRSTDLGETWTELTSGLGYSYYMAVIGDGETLYTREAYPASEGYGSGGMLVSTNGGNSWSAQASPGNQTMSNGPLGTSYDEVNDIVYLASWGQGLMALKPLRE
jgi:hypothetical protein